MIFYLKNFCISFKDRNDSQCTLNMNSFITKLGATGSVGWLCFTSHQQRGHLEMAPLFTVPCEGREAQF